MAEEKKEEEYSALMDFDKEAYFKKYKKDIVEMEQNQYVETDYPKTKHRYRVVFESYKSSIEEHYFWILSQIREFGFPVVEKIIDTFAAAEHSAFWGQASTRLGVQQDKVSQYLATIGKMIKDMFQLVRELRILDERLHYYEDSYDKESKSRESAEITLKGIYIDMAEGGSKNPSSVYGMARELQFTTLPDLFFSVHPLKSTDVDEEVNKLQFNKKVREVLKRKLRTFLEWKEHTYKELKTRRGFTLKYTRQHYDVIHMYLSWIRPYLRNISRLQSEVMEEKKLTTPDLVSAFEGSLVEIEFLARAMPEKNKEYYSCILANFLYRTRPTMSYQQEGYRHQGPLHVGRTDITMRAYAWKKEDIEAYKNMRAAEDFEMIGKIDRSVKDAMEGLGEELQKYLEEAGETLLLKKEKKPEKEEKESPSIVKKFFGEFISIKPKKEAPKKKPKVDVIKKENEIKAAESTAIKIMWVTYKNYKKAHRLLAW